MGIFNRTILILSIICRAAWLAYLKTDPQAIAGIVAAVSVPLTGYIVAKGQNGK